MAAGVETGAAAVWRRRRRRTEAAEMLRSRWRRALLCCCSPGGRGDRESCGGKGMGYLCYTSVLLPNFFFSILPQHRGDKYSAMRKRRGRMAGKKTHLANLLLAKG